MSAATMPPTLSSRETPYTACTLFASTQLRRATGSTAPMEVPGFARMDGGLSGIYASNGSTHGVANRVVRLGMNAAESGAALFLWDAETEEWAHRKSARWNSFVLSQDLVYVDDGSYSLDAGETFVETRPLADVPGEAEGLRKVVAVGLDVVAMVQPAGQGEGDITLEFWGLDLATPDPVWV